MEDTEVIDAPASSAVANINLVAAGLSEIKQRVASANYDLATTKGNQAARQDRAALVSLRSAVEARRVELVKPHVEAQRAINAAAKSITEQVLAIEAPLDKQIKADEERRAAEKKAREEADAERIAGHVATLQKLSAGTMTVLSPLAAIRERIEQISAIDTSAMEEFATRAELAKKAALDTLGEILRAAEVHAAEQQALAAQREQQRQEQARLDAQRAELERQQAEQRAAQEAAERAQREAAEAEQRRVEAERRAEAERVEAARRAEQERVEAARKAERERVEAERRAERARQEAEQQAAMAKAKRFVEAQERIVASLRLMADCIDAKVDLRQDAPDEPPTPADEWSYAAYQAAGQGRALADELDGSA